MPTRGINSGNIRDDSGVGPSAVNAAGVRVGGSAEQGSGSSCDAGGSGERANPANGSTSGPTIASIASAIPTDLELAALIAVWPTLNPAVRRAILAVVQVSAE